MIKDSGERTEYSTGFVRDCKVGKGRMDLIPLDTIVEFLRAGFADDDKSTQIILEEILNFRNGADPCNSLGVAIARFIGDRKWSVAKMMLELGVHFEEGAIKYGENNWNRGCPIHSYIDSALRHYMKYKDGWTDESHDRAFIWNLLCCIWTMENKPEMDDYTVNRKSE